ncbi:MAG: serine--tRNA ligase [Flavobacteriaceae bacterium]|nr:serine--tRNA ligase [Flavobacteriaceae bacterium]
MLQVQFIVENKETVLKGLAKRNLKNASQKINSIIELDKTRKETQSELDNILSETNKLSKEIGMFFKSGETSKANTLKAKVATLKEESKKLSEKLTDCKTQLDNALYEIPNIPNTKVPEGNSEDDNITIKEWGELPKLYSEAKPHWELVKQYDIIDFELGVKITGAGFPVYKGKGAKLQRALINYFLDKNTDAGYQELQVPHLVNEASGLGTGQLPDKEGQMYHCGVDNFYLIPTSEIPITNIYRDVIVKEAQFPIKHTAYTPCFRREAGSYGKDVKGLNRLHQFDKVELVRIEKPSESYKALDEMVEHVANILEELRLPYRILCLCAGDLGFTSVLTYDFEVWSAAQGRWLEVSSVSNFENFQANRLKLRHKDENGKSQLAHTLNGSSLALPRIMAALIENYQDENGVNIPEVLQRYTGFDVIN